MRKMKFWAAMALLVFAFMSGGCGGSASSDSDEESESTLHATVISLLKGTWSVPKGQTTGDSINLASTVNTSATTVYFENFSEFKLIFSDINFVSSADTSTGTAKVYYHLSCDVYDSARTSSDKLVASSGSSAVTMRVRRISDTQWSFSDSDTTITIAFNSLSDTENADITIEGTEYSSAFNSTLEYTFHSTALSKESTSTDIDDDSDDSKDTTDIADILEGNSWLFAKGTSNEATEEAKAHKDTDGTELTLKLASDVTMTFENVTLTTGDNATSLTGTVTVTYEQKWTAYDSAGTTKLVDDGTFTFSKNRENMRIVKVSDGIWRIEDTEKKNENIIITADSSGNEIKTVWTGTTKDKIVFNDGTSDTCTYNITCSFRKQ